MADVLVERLVLVLADVLARSAPTAPRLVDRLSDRRRRTFVRRRPRPRRSLPRPSAAPAAARLHHLHRHRDVVGVRLRDDAAQAVSLRAKLVLVFLQVQRDLGAALTRARRFRSLYSPSPVDSQRTPLRRRRAPARRVLTVTLSATMKRSRSRRRTGRSAASPWPASPVSDSKNSARTGASRSCRGWLDDLVAVHADAVVAHGHRARVLVDFDLDAQFGISLVQARRRSARRNAACRPRLRRWTPVRAGISRLLEYSELHNEVEQLTNFRLESPCLLALLLAVSVGTSGRGWCLPRASRKGLWTPRDKVASRAHRGKAMERGYRSNSRPRGARNYRRVSLRAR